MRTRFLASAWAAAGAAALLVAACAGKKPKADPYTCRITTTMNAGQPLAERTLPAAFWLALLVRGYHASGVFPRPVQDCTGGAVEWTADACGAGPSGPPVAANMLTERDLVISHAGGGRRLVWAITDRFANGEAQGPVALAHLDPQGVAVTTLGTLRAYGARAQLRLEKVGDGQVLLAEGEACTDESDPRTCSRGIRVVPATQWRFAPTYVSDAAGRCLGRAFFPLRAEGTRGQGTRRKSYRLQASVSVTADGVAVQEQIAISEPGAHTASADAAASAVARMRADRKIKLVGGRLIADGPGLLERWSGEEGGRAGASP
jgi:hypothetical protein